MLVHNIVAGVVWAVLALYATLRTLYKLYGAVHFIIEMLLVVALAVVVHLALHATKEGPPAFDLYDAWQWAEAAADMPAARAYASRFFEFVKSTGSREL